MNDESADREAVGLEEQTTAGRDAAEVLDAFEDEEGVTALDEETQQPYQHAQKGKGKQKKKMSMVVVKSGGDDDERMQINTAVVGLKKRKHNKVDLAKGFRDVLKK